MIDASGEGHASSGTSLPTELPYRGGHNENDDDKGQPRCTKNLGSANANLRHAAEFVNLGRWQQHQQCNGRSDIKHGDKGRGKPCCTRYGARWIADLTTHHAGHLKTADRIADTGPEIERTPVGLRHKLRG